MFEIARLRKHLILKNFRIGHRAVLAGDTTHRSVEIFEQLFSHASRYLSAEASIAWSLVGDATLRASPHAALPGEMVETAETSHREQLDLLTKRLHEIGGSVHMVAGEAGKVLPRLAERLDIGLIVMGTVARTGLSGLIMGNTAETIMRAVRCSVLAVKPEGFVTPVKPARPAKARVLEG